MKNFWFYVLPILLLSISACATKPMVENNYMALYSKKDSFENVVDAVKHAIAERGLVINNISYIGKMLSRTGQDVGAKQHLYQHAQALEFCSATISRATMEADVHNIVFCPYVIAVYEISGKPGTVHIAYRHLDIVGDEQSKQSLNAVETLLNGIVQDALEW